MTQAENLNPHVSPATRRRALISLYIITFCMWAGFFMVVPLISAYYVNSLGFTAATVGLALAIRQWVQQGLVTVTGTLSDRFDPRLLIALGMIVRALGFVLLGWAPTFPLLLMSLLLAALGGVFTAAPRDSMIAALTTPQDRARVFAVSSLAQNSGLVCGPLIGSLIVRIDFRAVCVSSAVFFIAVTFLLLLIPRLRVSTPRQTTDSALMGVMRDSLFVRFVIVTMGYWFVWSQLSATLPIVVSRLTGSKEHIGIIFAVNAGLSLALQYPLIRWLERFASPTKLMIAGLTIMGIGMGSISIANSLPVLVVVIAFYTIGTILAAPSQQVLIAELADPRSRGAYFGFSGLGLGVGGGLGNVLGGWLLDIATQTNLFFLPWLTFALVGLLTAAGLFFLARRPTFHQRSTSQPVLVS